jgi:cytochrome c peroxidase
MSLLRILIAVSVTVLSIIILGPLITSPANISWQERRAVYTLSSDPSAEDLDALQKVYAADKAYWPTPEIGDGVDFVELGALTIHKAPTGRDLQKFHLGQQLFEDPILSASGQIACQSCHNRELGWGDGLRVPFGHQRKAGTRNSPSLFNVGYRNAFFWDGRAKTLTDQATGPLLNPIEMANTDEGDIAIRLNLNEGYREAFGRIYGGDGIVYTQITDVLATFERYLERPTRFDGFANGAVGRLSNDEIWGLHLFRGKAGCANCHYGPLLTDEKVHNIGLTFFQRRFQDLGLYEVTGHQDDVGMFRTPSLRHVRSTGPYMHNGVMPGLRNVVAFYEEGGGHIRPRNAEEAAAPLRPFAAATSSLLHPLELTARERAALISFLESL